MKTAIVYILVLMAVAGLAGCFLLGAKHALIMSAMCLIVAGAVNDKWELK